MSLNDLGLTADLLIREFDEAVVGSSLVRFVQCDDDPDQVEIGIRPLDGHPSDELAGFRAPESWVALGLVSGGWVAPLGAVRPSAHPDARRITQVVLVDRQGRVESRVRFPDGTIMREPPSVGAVLDLLRVALGVADAA